MKTCLAFVSIFSSLVAPVRPLSCEDCIAPGNSCDGKMKACFLGEDTCGTIIGKAILGSVRSNGVLKTCTEYRACKAGIQSITPGPGMRLQRNALCCKNDSCQEDLEKLDETTQNGLSCPACYVQDSDSCEVQKMMDCTGSEDHCVYVAGVLESLVNRAAIRRAFVASGCATQSVCNHTRGLTVFSGNLTYTLSEIKECYSARDAGNSAYFHHPAWEDHISLYTICSIISCFCTLFRNP